MSRTRDVEIFKNSFGLDLHTSNGEVKSPGLYKRSRVYANIDSFEKSMTHQNFKDECDINKIMANFQKNGILPELIQSNPQFGDFSDLPTYQDSLNRVIFAQEQFAALPSQTRARFENDPSQFLAFANDPENIEEMISMGLATAPATTPELPPQKVVIIDPDKH